MRPPMGGFRSPGADNQGSGDGGRFCPPTLGQDGNGRGGQSYRHQSPYQTHSPSPYRRGFQGSPQTSTPFVRERGGGGVEKYYSPSMVQDPWASLKPVEVTQTGTKSSTPNTFHTGKTTRYF
ncbi:unnamed protein product [Boreogadus saida]